MNDGDRLPFLVRGFFMDADRFDTLARALFTTRSRRGVARLLGGMSLVGALAQLGTPDAAAVCGKVRTTKRRADTCKTSADCCAHARCTSTGRCKCKAAWADCNDDGRCETALGTEANCHECRDTCEEFEECRPEFGGKQCCRPLGEICTSIDQCCFQGGNSLSCRTIANTKGALGSCGFLEPNTQTRCCIPPGGKGGSEVANCDCCGDGVVCFGTCITKACETQCTRSCEPGSNCGGCEGLTCQPAPEQGDENKHRCLPA